MGTIPKARNPEELPVAITPSKLGCLLRNAEDRDTRHTVNNQDGSTQSFVIHASFRAFPLAEAIQLVLTRRQWRTLARRQVNAPRKDAAIQSESQGLA